MKLKKTWFKVEHLYRWQIKVEKIEQVLRETKQMIFYSEPWGTETRVTPIRKACQDHTLFDNQEDAIEHAINRATERVKTAEKRLEEARENLVEMIKLRGGNVT
jgi:guanylate kinase